MSLRIGGVSNWAIKNFILRKGLVSVHINNYTLKNGSHVELNSVPDLILKYEGHQSIVPEVK